MRRGTGSIVGAVMMLFIVALIGSILTFVIYALALLAALGLAVMITGWAIHRVERVRANRRLVAAGFRHYLGADPMTFNAADEEPSLDQLAPKVPEDMRHPAWTQAVQERTDARVRLIKAYLDLEKRYGRYARRETLHAWPEMVEVEGLCYKMWGTLPRETGQITSNDGRISEPVYNVATAPPAEEVLHLDRSFQLVTDCRYGHAAEHLIVGVTGLAGEGLDKLYADRPRGRIIRACEVCAPATRWTERP